MIHLKQNFVQSIHGLRSVMILMWLYNNIIDFKWQKSPDDCHFSEQTLFLYATC